MIDKHSIICENEKNPRKIISKDTQAYSTKIEKLTPYTLKRLFDRSRWRTGQRHFNSNLQISSTIVNANVWCNRQTLAYFLSCLHDTLSLKSDSLPSLTLLWPVLSIINCSSISLSNSRVAAVALREWSEKTLKTSFLAHT